ncbi:MAG: hypothetical protein RJA59_646 [Pseudomonadota bacterium]|jgi:hypothetical protein
MSDDPGSAALAGAEATAALITAEAKSLRLALDVCIADLPPSERSLAEGRALEDLLRRVRVARFEWFYPPAPDPKAESPEQAKVRWDAAAANVVKALEAAAAEDSEDGRRLARVYGEMANLSGAGPEATSLLHQVEVMFLWPRVREEWRKDRYGEQSFAMPGALVAGKGALAPAFGKRFMSRQQIASGRVLRVTVESGRSQLDLVHPSLLQITNPAEGEVLVAIGQVIGNAQWRIFLACLAMAQQDNLTGDGFTFWYWPDRLGETLGVSKPPSRGTYTAKQIERLDSLIADLEPVRVKSKVKANGKERDFAADYLVRPAGVTSTDKGSQAKRGGPRVRVLYEINPLVRELLQPKQGGWPVPVPTRALAAPSDVPQSTWDDAMKVFSVLATIARVRAQAGKAEGDFPWAYSMATLLEQANVTGDGVPARNARARVVRDLLPLLGVEGLLRYQVEGDGEETVVRFDIPTQRAKQSGIRARRPRKNVEK